MSKWWVTSDWHLDHGNIIKYCQRLAFCTEQEKNEILRFKSITDPKLRREEERKLKISQDSIRRMNDTIIGNINKKVAPNDTLINLGDGCFGARDRWEYHRNKINCKNIIWIMGNHDKDFNHNIFSHVYPHYQAIEMKIEGQRYLFSHYAFRVWDDSHGGKVKHFWGHSHGQLPDDPTALSFDAGVDCHDFQPLCIPTDTDKIFKKKQTNKPWYQE